MYKDMRERERESRFCSEEKRNIKVAKICINVAFCSNYFVTLHQTLKYCAFLECNSVPICDNRYQHS